MKYYLAYLFPWPTRHLYKPQRAPTAAAAAAVAAAYI